ncbi:hypothetical protein DNTS_016604 [Danionella cerebrum]|uniref:RZ-type domain-containing protein n=1 Tax=Danionella cerebrum TaxID=2873325 RepID=A0A553R5G7_9TELE|nr:hypothetical protein DNTS_016604 [Danionella translucida]
MMSNPKGGKQRGRGVSVPARNRGRGRGGGDGSQQQAGRSAISQRERGLDDDVQGAVGGGRGQGLRHGSWSGFHRPVMRGGANSSSPFQGRTGISAAHSIPSLLRLGNLNETPGRPSIFKGNCRGKMDALRVQGGYGIGRARVDASRSMADLRPSPRGGGNRRGKTGSQSHGRSRGGARDGPREIHKIGYKTLEGLLEKDASEVAISLSSSTGLRLLLEESEIRNDLVQLLCKVLCKAFQSRIDRSTVMHLAQIIKDSKFFRHGLPYHVTGMMSEFANAQREQYPQHLNNILNLLSSVLNIFPRSSIQSVSMVVALLKTTVHQLRASGVDILENTDQELERLQSLVDQLQEKSREGTLRSDDYSCHAANEDTPPGEQDFREISIYPIYEEFHENRRPFLRPNRITQSFPNAHIYLDTHFRLLREDFVRPLRDGVKEILSMVHEENLNENQIQKKHFDDVRIYNDTHLLLPVCTPTGIAYRVTFDARQLQFVRWENSKRLIYGSLVCLSMDKFETFLFATVADRDPELLRKGEVNLCFSLNSREQLASIRPSDSFLMVETTAYFEAYRYVLEGLQELSQDEFPFQRYIVQCVTAVDPPAYLRVEGRTYDLSPVAPKGQSIPRFNPLTPQAWPDEEKLGLDESQLQAFKLALTNELAIIQGPPGTGKTFVGLKIARALLENREAWSQDCPMLVVCYTNHALDQFLEGIYRFLRWGIVRVGGRSNSEILKPFNLRELTRGRDFHHNLPMHLRRAFEDVKKEMQNSKERLEEHSIKSECSLGGIIREEILRSYMDEEHWNSLRAGLYEPKQKTTVIAEWLGVSFSAFKSFPSTEEKAAADEATSQAEEAGLIRVEEEAELIQAERMLQEVSFPWKKERSKQEEEKLKRDAVVKAMVVLTLSDDESCNQTIQKNQKKKLKKTVKEELKKTSCMSEVQEKHLTDLWGLSMKDRWSLYRLWVFRYRCDLRNKALTYEQEYQRAADRLSEVRQHEDLSVLREARVVGMTTTGAAKYRQVLQELRPRLVIIEEAAEVLEAHTITTLSQACQHLILIGDHQQLRPSATVYDLAKNYNLEVSMFERLVKMDFPFVRLNYQHRMRPSIARLLTPHIYKSLENHPSVLEYENVKGVLGNVFFVDHSHFEDEIQDGRTRKNTHEAHFVVKLCRYLLLQEYKPSQITILTTYTGQLHCLRKLMPFSEFSDVKVHVVDKYQGEENDIIILSLVRSNSENRVGFLNIPNRVCVALSRAKMGLYCIGNMGMLSSVPLWSNILQTLREQGQVGEALILSCQNHPDKQIHASCASDFKAAPEGGCDQPCQFRLECGHVCTRMCHPYDADHKKFMCLKECPKVLCELEHKCPLRCYERCEECWVLLDKIIPSCQHHQKVPCHQDPKDFICRVPCVKILPCEHPCRALCGDPCTARCKVRVPTELKCGHMQEEPCYVSRDPTVNPRYLSWMQTRLPPQSLYPQMQTNPCVFTSVSRALCERLSTLFLTLPEPMCPQQMQENLWTALGNRRGRTDAQRDLLGPWRGRGNDGIHEVKKICYKTLEGLLEKDASEVAITLSSSTGLDRLLEEPAMRSDQVQLLCEVLCKAFQSRIDRSTVMHLAQIVKDSKFFQHVLPYHVTKIVSEVAVPQREQYPQHLNNILNLLSNVLNIFPRSSIQSVSIAVALLKTTIHQLRASGVDILENTDQELERLQSLVDQLQEKSREGTLRSDDYSRHAANEDTPPGEQDFREISIYPIYEEFHENRRPFLRPNRITQSFPNAHIYLDTHFRLLREDFVRPLRDGVKEILSMVHEENLNENQIQKKHFDDVRIYNDTHLLLPVCTPTGIAYRVTFDARQLQFVRWENSKRLIYGSLVCLSMDKFETFLFATVADRDPELLRKGEVNLCFSLNSREQLASIRPSDSFLMVETTAYFEAYRYVLEGLQELSQDEFPFQRYIVQCVTAVDPPAYLRVEGRTYDLSPVAPKGQSIPRFNPLTPQAWPDEEKLGLDESQLQAFKLALTNELAIIQGPPGTGKTFVGLKIARALLENREAWSQDCPMLVVCYTNHALDQFLEGIHGFLKSDIVRVGGRSESNILKPFALRELTRRNNFHKNLPAHLRRAHAEVSALMDQAKQKLNDQTIQLECSLNGIIHEKFLERYIDEEHWNSLLLGPVLEDWEKEEKENLWGIIQWLCVEFLADHETQQTEGAEVAEHVPEAEKNDLIEVEEEANLVQAERMLQDDDVNWEKDERKQRREEFERRIMAEKILALNLSEPEPQKEKWQKQKHHKKKLKDFAKHELKKTSIMSEEQEKSITDLWSMSLKDRWTLYREVRQHEDLSVLREARVVGMTTTGAAKYRQVLQELRPRLVIIEEAAEVLEAHTITTLSQACQHLILIGDHQQLRPSATVYDLAKNYNLEVSMFERLVKMDFPFVRLNYQHRMRPSIARLLTPHIYKSLENHPSVLEYENVKGVLGNVFFVDHSHFEDKIQDGRTRKNTHEAHFVVKLCRYLLLQEYKPSQITILTTYTGQLHCLRKLMPSSEFSDVKVHVVDKYQGEENDIIILSLVRSNSENRVGFLNIPNRVCVALSRAKMGLYCIGNMGMLSSVPLWSNILQTLREQGQVGEALILSCQNHPDKQIHASCASDFKAAPEGGCDQPCQFRLECGHVCTRMCHPYDADHKKFMCLKECPKVLCELEHKCPLRCYETCKKCRVPVDKIIPSCQHHQKVPCHQEPKDFKCQVQVPTELKCGHMQEEPCYDSRDPTVNPRCLTKCGFTLKCGHSCPGTCHGCKQGCLHKACTHKCKRILVCSHQCREPCVRDCPPCSLPCQNRCVHSKCEKTCGQPCAPCREPCIWQCPHHSCTKLCHEPCDRPPCSVSCPKYLPCGHPCIGLCGETCPDKCRICHKDKVTEIFFGNEDEPDACFIQLEDCQHLFEISGMDRYISQDEDQDAELDQRAIRLKECPRCRTPIRRNLRYGTHINRSLAAIEMVKEKISGVAEINKQKQKELNLQLRKQDKLRRHFHKEFEFIQEELKTRKLSLQQLWHYENLMSFLERIGKLKSTENDYLPSPKVECLPFTQKMNNAFKFVTDQGQRFSEQQISDLESELSRLSYLADLNQRSRIRRPEVVSEIEVQQLRAILEDDLPFSEAREQRVKQIFTELDVKLPRIGLGITDQERVSIVKAMGLNKGHWYKCPNGHVYAIGDCGGAMVKTKCPECDSAIGGTNHSLTEGNAVATEMDGAQHPAWSDAANMANFDLRDFYD